jgi:hypothetical protein
VIAPAFSADAIAMLSRKKNLRVLELGPLASYRRSGWDLRRVQGGLLAQDWDQPDAPIREGRVATRRAPNDEEWKALQFAWTVVRHVKSNAIVYASSTRTLGIGAGQMSRVDSARFGIQKSLASLRGAAMASDAFFPFRDGLDVAAEAGITAVVQPGGSNCAMTRSSRRRTSAGWRWCWSAVGTSGTSTTTANRNDSTLRPDRGNARSLTDLRIACGELTKLLHLGIPGAICKLHRDGTCAPRYLLRAMRRRPGCTTR